MNEGPGDLVIRLTWHQYGMLAGVSGGVEAVGDCCASEPEPIGGAKKVCLRRPDQLSPMIA